MTKSIVFTADEVRHLIVLAAEKFEVDQFRDPEMRSVIEKAKSVRDRALEDGVVNLRVIGE